MPFIAFLRGAGIKELYLFKNEDLASIPFAFQSGLLSHIGYRIFFGFTLLIVLIIFIILQNASCLSLIEQKVITK